MNIDIILIFTIALGVFIGWCFIKLFNGFLNYLSGQDKAISMCGSSKYERGVTKDQWILQGRKLKNVSTMDQSLLTEQQSIKANTLLD
jgi:hypothetical protein